jgi:predicted HAD superfamily hydrolase
MLNQPSVKYYSFDVFDTAITRNVSYPIDLFVLLTEKLLHIDIESPQGFLDHFSKIRILSEQKARKSKISREVTLDEIYDCMSREYHLSPKIVDRLKTEEIQAEYESMQPIDYTKTIIDQVRRKGLRPIFISDTYMTQDMVRNFLTKCDCYQPGDDIFVSSEMKISKKSGKLFKWILEKKNIKPAELCHLGDNPWSDVMVPYQLGIKVFYPVRLFDVIETGMNHFKHYLFR